MLQYFILRAVTNKNTEAMSEANESDAVEMPPSKCSVLTYRYCN